MSQKSTHANQTAWNNRRYDAWVAAYGMPADAAAVVVADPSYVLRRLLPYLGDLNGQRLF